MSGAEIETSSVFAAANALFDQHKFQQSAEAYAVIARQPGYEAEGHFGRGLSLLNLDDLATANEEFLLTLQFKPKHAGALFELGEIAEKRSNLTEAVRWYNTALEADPTLQAASERVRALPAQDLDVQPLPQPQRAAPSPRPPEREVPSSSSTGLSKQRPLLVCLLPLMASIVICVAISVFSPARNSNDNSLLVRNELPGIKAQIANVNSAIASITANINSLEQATGADNKLAQEYLANAKATLKSAEAQRDRLEAEATQLSNSISSAGPRNAGTLPLWILLAGAIGTVVTFIAQRPRFG